MDLSTDFILGIGTGRCGSNTLTELLRINGIDTIHEGDPKPNWDGSSQIDVRLLGQARVAHWWLNYVPQICEARDTKIIALKRDKQVTVESYLALKGANQPEEYQLNHFRPSGTTNIAVDRTYPTYQDGVALIEGLNRFWDEYYATVDKYIEQGYPIRVFKTEDLSLGKTQEEILHYIGIIEKPVIYPGLQLWRREAVLEQLQRKTCERAYIR